MKRLAVGLKPVLLGYETQLEMSFRGVKEVSAESVISF